MSFSYSRISMFERCPKKYEYRYITKFEIPDNDNMIFEKGRYIHAILEHYPELPEFEFKYKDNKVKRLYFLNEISHLCKHDNKIKYLLSKDVMYERELKFHLNESLLNSDENDSYVNGIIDYVGKTDDKIILVDWKSGKSRKYASFEQLKLYSIWAFNTFPDINIVKAFLIFVEQNIFVYEEITRDECELIKNNLKFKLNDIEKTTSFCKKVKEDCQYCDYRTDCQPYKVKI